MEDRIMFPYDQAPRFDEGELYQSPEYGKIVRERMKIRKLLEGNLNPILYRLLDDYDGTFFDEMEMEAQHFFREGYRAQEPEQ